MALWGVAASDRPAGILGPPRNTGHTIVVRRWTRTANEGVYWRCSSCAFSLSSLARLAIGTILISSAAAIGLARLAPPSRGWRMLSPSRYANVNTFYLDPGRRGSSWVDREGGAMLDLPFSDDELLEYASCSPWRDEQGRAQVVGRWSWGFRGETPDMSYGLARVTFPDGKIIDHVETQVVPVSNPCWYPGTRARVLFAAGDGKLYQYAFESVDGGEIRDERPRPIVWNCKVPGGDAVFLAEPYLPADPSFSHLLFVGLRTTESKGGRPSSTPASIWWLRLSDGGGSIEEAGRLMDPPSGGEEVNERCPILGRTSDGRPCAGLSPQGPRSHRTELRLLDLELDPETRCPRPAAGIGTKLADDCLPNPPIISADGRWISVVQEGDRKSRFWSAASGWTSGPRPSTA